MTKSNSSASDVIAVGNASSTLRLVDDGNTPVHVFAAKINSNWQRTTEGLLETARLCAEADARLNRGEKDKLHKELDFSKATFSKLVKIGSHPQLQSEPLKGLLPPNYSIVYEVAKLKDTELKVAIEEGVISPGMSRTGLRVWLGKNDPKGDDPARPRIFATVQVPPDYDSKQESLLEQALEKLRSKFGFRLERPCDPETAALDRMAGRMNRHIRSEARRFIAALKSRKLQGGAKLSAAEKKQLWPYSDDEVAIAPDATWEQVKAALDFVGYGDQFERIRDEALRLYDVPEKVISTQPLDDPRQALELMRAAIEQKRAKNGAKRNPDRYAGWKF